MSSRAVNQAVERLLNTEPTWGRSQEADFEKGTWTFHMVGDDWNVSAGAYALIYNDDYQEFVKLARRLKHAEGILWRIQETESEASIGKANFEAVESFFDPEPL